MSKTPRIKSAKRPSDPRKNSRRDSLLTPRPIAGLSENCVNAEKVVLMPEQGKNAVGETDILSRLRSIFYNRDE